MRVGLVVVVCGFLGLAGCSGGVAQSSTVSASSNANPSIIGNSLYLTATVGSASATSATGYVTFMEDENVLGIADVVAGQATLPISSATNEAASLCTDSDCLGPGTVVKKVSQLGCAYQDADLFFGWEGHDDTVCINSALASATEAQPIIIWQDGVSNISVQGIRGPATGYWGIIGNGGAAITVHITGCSISQGVATLTTTANTLVAGQPIELNNFSTCTSLNNLYARVSAIGLSSTKFEVAASGSASATAEATATATSVSGTGFVLTSGTGDLISDGVVPASWGCEVPVGPMPSRGSNVLFKDFVLNGRTGQGNFQYCFGIDLRDMDKVRIENVMFYNTLRYAINLTDVSNVVVTGSKFVTSYLGGGTTTDGIHVDGPAKDLNFTNDYFQTADDSVALNATEGYCGPISRVRWTNSTLDSTWDAIRIYNGDLNTCSNGLVPLIDTVYLDNVSGSIYSGIVGNFGAPVSGLGNLNPAITQFQWNNSIITNNSLGETQDIFWLTDNVGTMSLTNFTFVNPNAPGFFAENIGAPLIDHVGALTLNNFTVERTPAGNTLDGLLGGKSSGRVDIGTININGFTILDEGGSFGRMSCLLCSPSPYTFLFSQANINDVDYLHVANLIRGSSALNVTTPYAFGPYQVFNEFPVGQHIITAYYSGDQNNSPSTSLPFTQTVLAASSNITLTPGANPSTANVALTLTCSVTGTGTPTGTVTLEDETGVIGVGNLNSGAAIVIVAGLTPGSHSITAVYSGDTNNRQSVSLPLLQTVVQAVPSIIWPSPAVITYGTALCSTQLDATASVPGSFAYSPTSGTVLSAGTRSTSVTFTPADTTNYSTATVTVQIVVDNATPIITWASHAAIAYGTALSSTQLNATVSVPGTFAYTPTLGAVLPAGIQTLSL